MTEFSRLLFRAQRGDRPAMGLLLEKFRGHAERAARVGLGPALRSRFDTADIVQSVFGDVVREGVLLDDRGERSFRGWLATRVRHKLCTKARRLVLRRGLRKEIHLVPALAEHLASRTPEPDVDAARQDDAARLRRLLGTLDPEDRTVIGLRIHESLPWSEVAGRLQLRGPDAARMRYVRALGVLRERWNKG